MEGGISKHRISFGVDGAGDVERIFHLAEAFSNFWHDHAEEIESGSHRVLCELTLVEAQPNGSEVLSDA